ncbi:MAG: homoserine dehydrogenase [Tissierellia bacterium]|nr:homoserine dehydrogenase [Tissierellia bacterium]
MVNIGLLGFGTVGIGVFQILESREEELKNICGCHIKIKKILVKDLNKNRPIKVDASIITDNFDEILEDEDISIIIEATGALEEGYTYISKALKAGKHVVTANKAVVSKHFEELTELADKMDLYFLYEASVGGGIPIIKNLKELLVLNEIVEIKGILNGTCNYILTKMEEGLNYSEALKIAQEKGFAELDPTDDVEGLDARRKLRILGSLALKAKILEKDIFLRGLRGIGPIDIEYVDKMDGAIRLIGEIKVSQNGYTAIVEPIIVSKNSPFYNVHNEKNAVLLRGDQVGDLIFYGSGAGRFPTAHAVLCDVIDIVRGVETIERSLAIRELENINKTIKGRYYLRLSKSSQDIYTILESIAWEVLHKEENIIIMTKDMFLNDILKLIKVLEVKEEDYFLARKEG